MALADFRGFRATPTMVLAENSLAAIYRETTETTTKNERGPTNAGGMAAATTASTAAMLGKKAPSSETKEKRGENSGGVQGVSATATTTAG